MVIEPTFSIERVLPDEALSRIIPSIDGYAE